MEEAFARSSAAGLVLLAGQAMGGDLPPEFVFWRGFARQLFEAVCHLGEAGAGQWRAVPPPADVDLDQLVVAAPPMRGLEYLDGDLLRRLWGELAELVADEAAACQAGPAAWLRGVNPLWHLLGRVTFHLAENKRDPDRPFAFLATYTHRLSERSKVAHLPLAER